MPSINTNIAAYYAQNNLRAAGQASQTSIARLSSGNKIINASDDVAALSIGTILRTNVSTLKTALTNASQGSTLLQVADGSLAQVGEILQRQKALATQSNSGTLSDTEKGYLNQEFQKLKDELDRIVDTTNFNNVKLLDGSISGAAGLHGAATASAQTMTGFGTSAVSSVTFAAGAGALHTNIAGKESDALVTIDNLTGTTNDVTITMNGTTFIAKAVNLTSTGQTITATAADGATLAVALGSTSSATAQPAADTLAASIQADLRSGSVYQTRAIDNTTGKDYAIDADKFDGTILQGRDGSSFVLKSSAYNTDGNTAPAISGWTVSKYTSSNAGKISVTVDGQVYSAKLTAATIAGSGTVTLTSESDSNSTLVYTNGSTAINVDTDTGASALQDALNAGFGTGSSSGLNFQVGVASTDKIGITIAGLSSSKLFVKDDGTAVSMDLVSGNIDDMQQAIDNAIQTVTARRADVGALQSRFNYVSATLDVSVQNLDAARGQFLDADISEESTNFAKAQVLQQAAISVLAQANQIPQNLLKLIS